MTRETTTRFVLVLFVAALGFFSGYFMYSSSPSVSGNIQCHTIQNTSDEIQAGYGSPFNLFSNPIRLAMQVVCNEDGATINIGSGGEREYIYNYALFKKDGKWKRVRVSGSREVGSWVVGSGSFVLEKSALNDGDNKIAAYICQEIEGVWKCGCKDEACVRPYWQLQEFTYDEEYFDNLEISDDVGNYARPPVPNNGPVGTRVVIEGNGFSAENNTIYFDEIVVANNVNSENGEEVEFYVPAYFEPGLYSIRVETEDGEEISSTSFLVIDPTVSVPIVTRIEPAEGMYGEMVTIHGENFSQINNEILVGSGTIEGVASPDGNSITFSMEPPTGGTLIDEAIYSMEGDTEFKIYMYVINEGGVSEDYVLFVLKT